MNKYRGVKDQQDGQFATDRALTIAVGVVVEKREARSRWVDHLWVPVAVVPGRPALSPGAEMMRGEGVVRYYLGPGEIDLHRAEAEAYRFNLDSADPALYVVLRRCSESPLPWRVQEVTASPYHAQDYLDSAEDIVERLPFPDEIRRQVELFAAAHYRPEPFRKRRRDRVETEELQFGKEPVFLNRKQKLRGDWDG